MECSLCDDMYKNHSLGHGPETPVLIGDKLVTFLSDDLTFHC
jgi:hypothetical protein